MALVVPNYVYAGGPESAAACFSNGYNQGLDDRFHHNVNRDCERFTDEWAGKNPYYDGWIQGCKAAVNTEEICETFTDE